MPSSQTKKNIRQEKRRLRKALSENAQHAHAQKIFYRLQKLPEFIRAKNIAFYLSSDGELSLEKILEYAQRNKKKCFLPCIPSSSKILPGENKKWREMSFHEYLSTNSLKKNIFSILQPKHGRKIPHQKIDLVFMPLVAFDEKKNRLGMGGGFYDRCFSYKHRHPFISPKLIGIAHSLQTHTRLPISSWDVPLHCVVTESAIIR